MPTSAADGQVELRSARLTDPEVGPLLAGLQEEYHRRYGPNDEMSFAHPEQFEPPGGLFLVAVDVTGPAVPLTVAGGGYRCIDPSTCEVKRMWTHPAYRRRGLAVRVLAELERQAAAAGYRRLILETGPLQPEAIALYTGRGYRSIPVFGPYQGGLAFETDLGEASG